MRAFRIKKRLLHHFDFEGKIIKSNKVHNQRDYIGIESFLKHGVETYDRYFNGSYSKYVYTAELYEKINNKWVLINIEDILNEKQT